MNESYINRLARALKSQAGIPDEEFNKLAEIARPLKIRKNAYFIKAGESSARLGFIISGIFRCYHLDQAGAEYTKHFFQENDFMTANVRSLIDKEDIIQESEYDYQALENSLILQFDKAEFRTRLTHPCWKEVFANRLEQVHKIEERRIRQLLLLDAETRYLKFLEDFPGLENRIKQTHVASYIGISPVSLSRIRTNLSV